MNIQSTLIPAKKWLAKRLRQSQAFTMRTQDVVFPAFCQVCNQAVSWPLRGGICGYCIHEIPTIACGCSRCGAEIPASLMQPTSVKLSDPKRDCIHCRKGAWPTRRIYAFGTYGGKLAKILVLLKRPGSEPSAITLGNAMADWLGEQIKLLISNDELPNNLPFDAIVSVPKFWMRRISQRHNAAELLAESIADKLGIPLWNDGIIQTRPTSKQGLLLANQRRQNVEGAFVVNRGRAWKGKRILIVDDIVTSGSTIGEIATILKRAQVASVDGLCAARGVGSGGK